MTVPGTGDGRWRPDAGWQLRRVLTAVVPLVSLGMFALHWTGRLSFSTTWVVLLVVGVVSVLVGRGQLRGRQESLRGLPAVAPRSAWRYLGANPRLTGLWSTYPFGQGHSRSATDVQVGRHAGFDVAVFAYAFTTGSGDDRRTTSCTVTVVRLPAPLPPLACVPRGLLRDAVDAVAAGLPGGHGAEPVRIEDEDFNARFHVVCADPRYAHALLNPRAVEGLLRTEPFAWQVEGADLVGWSTVDGFAPPLTPQVLLARLDALAGLARHVPSFLYGQAEPAPPQRPGWRPGPPPGRWARPSAPG